MRRIKTLILLLVLISTGQALLYSQALVAVSGGNISGSSGTAGYTVGQFMTGEASGSDGRVIQGIQQLYDIIVINNITDGGFISLEAKVFPNPVADNLTLSIPGEDMSGYTMRLFDSRGALLRTLELSSPETSIPMETLASGIYYINVYRNNQQAAVFKIVKK